MTRLLDMLYGHLEAKGVTRDEFMKQLAAYGYEDEATIKDVMENKEEPCVGIVAAAQEILDLTDAQADALLEAGREDAKERLGYVK